MPTEVRSTCWRVALSEASTVGNRVAPVRALRFSWASRSRALACVSVGLAASAARTVASSLSLPNRVHHCWGGSPGTKDCDLPSAGTVATGCGPGV
ncbi:hypothetical protein D3C85_1438000 [compost metagenome]